MSYTPTNWATGDVITAEKLNKLEQGVASAGGGGALIVTIDENNALDHTWKEISDNKFAVLDDDGAICYLVQIVSQSFSVVFLNLGTQEPLIFAAESADDYPVLVQQAGGGGT